MSVTYLDFINSAKKIILDDNEIDYRNASSRAYYAAYHKAGPVGIKIGISLEVVTRHALLIRALIKQSNSHYRKIGYMLRQIKYLREDADYRLNERFTKDKANDSINQSERIQKLLDHSPS